MKEAQSVKHIYTCLIGCLWCAALWLLPAGDCAADLQVLAGDELARISGSGGLSIGVQDAAVFMHTAAFTYVDSDTGNALTLEGLTLSNGAGRPASFSTGGVDVDGDRLVTPLTIDVMTYDDPALSVYGKAVVALKAMDWLQAAHLHAEILRFCGQDLGSLDIGVLQRPSFYWLLGAHDSGIDIEYGARIDIDTLRLTYNTNAEHCALNGIHFGAQDSGAPQDPSAWRMEGLFRIGDMAAGRPATLDVGQDADGWVAIHLNLPMAGAIRVENLAWAGTDFGPLAIDGIQVHRLSVRFVP
jgi:hypothetical protein